MLTLIQQLAQAATIIDLKEWGGLAAQGTMVGVLVYALRLMMLGMGKFLEETRRAESERTNAVLTRVDGQVTLLATTAQAQAAALSTLTSMVEKSRETVHALNSLNAEIRAERYLISRGDHPDQGRGAETHPSLKV